MADQTVEYDTIHVQCTAAIMVPKGTVRAPGTESGLLLPCGDTVKFWVGVELVDEVNDEYYDLDYETMKLRGMFLEHTGSCLSSADAHAVPL